MRTAVIFVMTLTVALVLAQSLKAQTISLGDFLTQLEERHPIFRSERLLSQIAAEEQNALSGAEDWMATSSASVSHDEAAFAGLGPERTTAVALTGGLERAIWKTGGRVSSSLSLSRVDLDIDPFLGYPDGYYQTEFGVSYAHPLMRNRGGALDRLAHDLKQYDVVSSEIVALESEERFLADAAAKFLDWAFLTEQRRITTERLRLSEEELERTIRKRDAFLVDEADVIRAEDAVRFWQQSLVLTESQWKAVQAELAVLSQNDDLYGLTPSFDLYETVDLPPLAEARGSLTESSRLVRDVAVRLEQLRHVKRGYEETAKPDLSLVAGVTARGADEHFLESLVTDKPDAVLALQLALPLKNQTATSQVAKTDLEIARVEEQLDSLTLSLVSALSSMHSQILELEGVLALNREQIDSARRRTDEELKLYKQGRGELTFVILSRDNEQQAQLTYAQNALTYHRLLVEYRALTDELHDRPISGP